MSKVIDDIAKEFMCSHDVARQAYNVWKAFSCQTDSFDVGKRYKDFMRRTVNQIRSSENDEISPITRKMFPRYGD